MERLKPGSGLYNVPIAYRIEGELNLVALEQSINTIIERHHALRTKFQTVDGELKQIVQDGVAWKAEVVELGEFAEADRESELQRLTDDRKARDAEGVNVPRHEPASCCAVANRRSM